MQVSDEVIHRETGSSVAMPASVPVAYNGVKGRIVSLYALLVGFNVAAWIGGQRQLFLSTGDNYFFPVDWVNSFICLVLGLPPFGGTESLAR